MAQEDQFPVLGQDPRRSRIAYASQIFALALLLRHFQAQGHFEVLGTYFRVWNPLVKPCGHLPAKEFVILSDRILRPHGAFPGFVHVRGGRIAGVTTGTAGADRHTLVSGFARYHGHKLALLDYGAAVVGPGLVDVHAHLNEPGREEWEGMDTGTAAAAAGGVTTVADMPLNSAPCTTTPALLKDKLKLAKAKARVDVAFWAGLVPANAHKAGTLRRLARAGASGFKAFMCPSGIDDFPSVAPSDVAAALPAIKGLGLPLLVHAELVGEGGGSAGGDPRQYATYLATRPPSFERDAVEALLAVLRADTTPAKAGFRVHVVHLSDASLLGTLRAARAEGLPITVETCPHYLTFAAEDVPEGDTRFKCAPPLRDTSNREALWAGVAGGEIDLLSSDHSPSPPHMKLPEAGDFLRAWGGIAGLQYALPATWEGGQRHGLNLTALAQLWSEEPARLAGLQRRKGRLAEGWDADIVVWSPEAEADTSAAAALQRHKGTSPYLGAKLRGRVLATFVRGSEVYSEREGLAGAACGGVAAAGA